MFAIIEQMDRTTLGVIALCIAALCTYAGIKKHRQRRYESKIAEITKNKTPRVVPSAPVVVQKPEDVPAATPDPVPDPMPDLFESVVAEMSQPVESSHMWKWDKVEPGRMERARSVVPVEIRFEPEPSAEFYGSSYNTVGQIYRATLNTCECVDFTRRHKEVGPCKHILSLALNLHVIDENGNPVVDAPAPECPSPAPVTEKKTAAKRSAGRRKGQTVSGAKVSLTHDDAIALLKSAGVEYVDKSGRGGGLYVFDESTAIRMHKMGYKVRYTINGNRSTGYRPAWYMVFK